MKDMIYNCVFSKEDAEKKYKDTCYCVGKAMNEVLRPAIDKLREKEKKRKIPYYRMFEKGCGK